MSAIQTTVYVVGMLATGAANSLFSKFQDNVVVGHDAQGKDIRFEQPTYQTATMFLGEAM